MPTFYPWLAAFIAASNGACSAAATLMRIQGEAAPAGENSAPGAARIPSAHKRVAATVASPCPRAQMNMAYLAWVLWHADGAAKARPPMGFWGAVAFQAVNPKALLMALTAAGGFQQPGGGPLAMASLEA